MYVYILDQCCMQEEKKTFPIADTHVWREKRKKKCVSNFTQIQCLKDKNVFRRKKNDCVAIENDRFILCNL